MPLTMTLSPPTGYNAPEDRPFVEYPKWVHRTGQKSVIVNNRDEESALLDAGEEPTPIVSDLSIEDAPAIATLSGPNDEREMLIKIADSKNIHIDKRWTLERIRRTVEAASPIVEE